MFILVVARTYSNRLVPELNILPKAWTLHCGQHAAPRYATFPIEFVSEKQVVYCMFGVVNFTEWNTSILLHTYFSYFNYSNNSLWQKIPFIGVHMILTCTKKWLEKISCMSLNMALKYSFIPLTLWQLSFWWQRKNVSQQIKSKKQAIRKGNWAWIR